MSRNPIHNFLLSNFIENKMVLQRWNNILNQRKAEGELPELAEVSAYMRFGFEDVKGSV